MYISELLFVYWGTRCRHRKPPALTAVADGMRCEQAQIPSPGILITPSHLDIMVPAASKLTLGRLPVTDGIQPFAGSVPQTRKPL